MDDEQSLMELLAESSADISVFDEERTAAELRISKSQQEINGLELQNRLRAEELESRRQDREQRKEYADKIFCFLCFFIVFVGIFVFIAGLELSKDATECHFRLSENVLIALLTTTSANVIGIFVFVVKYLFNVPASKDQN